MSRLSPQRVEEVLLDCLFQVGEDTESQVGVKAIQTIFGFKPERLAAHTQDIRELLAELPSDFHGAGNGQSFLNACLDLHGNQWTGEHQAIEALVALGLATGQVEWCLPRKYWSALPGGMPYFRVIQPRGE